MPYVNIKITDENVTEEKKAVLVKAVTELLERELGKNPETTVVTIDVYATDSWGIGAELVKARRLKGK